MADHVISLSAEREAALQKIVDDLNRDINGNLTGTQTKDSVLRDWVLAPIKERIRRDRELADTNRGIAMTAAPATVIAQVDELLRPYMPVSAAPKTPSAQ